MTKYFEPFEIEEKLKAPTVDPVDDPEPEVQVEPSTLAELIGEVRAEIGRVQSGRSDLIKYALQLGSKGGSPVMESLKSLEAHSSRQAVADFLEITDQDIGRRHALYFANIFEPAYPGITQTLEGDDDE